MVFMTLPGAVREGLLGEAAQVEMVTAVASMCVSVQEAVAV